MSYIMINEKLQIASCSIADLTMDQVQHFLKHWHPGDSIGTLTLFYERETGLLVLNQDNKCYSFYKDLAEKYLAADEKRREKFTKKASEELGETLAVLDNCIKHRTIYDDINKAKKNLISNRDRKVVEEMIRADRDCLQLAVFNAFCYGMMQGKRAERARRKVKGGVIS